MPSACAACHYHKKLCEVDCPFLPYFPADKKDQFEKVRRLFGVDRVRKILTTAMDKDSRDDSVTSIIYEANMRADMPASGCWSAIAVLLTRIERCKNELRNVKKSIASVKANVGRQAQAAFFEGQEYGIWDQELIDAIGLVQHMKNNNLTFLELFIGDLLRQIISCEDELQNVVSVKAKLVQNSEFRSI